MSDDDVAELVRSAMGGGAQPVDGTKKIAEMIDLMLLEFRSLTKEEQDKRAAPSLFPETLSFRTSPPPRRRGRAATTSPLGGLADELEGPEPTPQEDSSSVASWFRGLIPR